jgi:hypothetical protein
VNRFLKKQQKLKKKQVKKQAKRSQSRNASDDEVEYNFATDYTENVTTNDDDIDLDDV